MQPGHFTLGVCWYPEQWPESRWRRDAARMREMGITTVRLGEFAWSRLQPARRQWDGDWLRRALDILHENDLRAILGTPSAAPPRWLLDEFPDLLRVDAGGAVSAFGSRRFACLAHAGYARACVTVARKMAREFGAHPAVCAWQIDNEYACHDTAQSWSARAARLFRRWLRLKYRDIGALNRAWGNAFWSMEYADFAQIEPPRATPAGNNPAHLLDFHRFWSARITVFNRRQVNAVRRHAPGRTVLHDFMGFSTGFDHFALAADLDSAAWNSYPLGFLARHGGDGDGDGNDGDGHGDGENNARQKYLRLGAPDHAAFHHDLYRACGRGRFCVTEQQPGAVNWAAYNPQPLPGAVRFWTWEAFAHGAEMVAYFRWRQLPRAQELMHAGLLRPDDRPAPGAAEVAQVAHELAGLPAEAFAPAAAAPVALVFDYESCWMRDALPHGDAPALAVYLAFYAALRRAGMDVDIVPPAAADFTARRLVVAPLLFAPSDDFVARLRSAGCAALFGARCGSLTAECALPEDLPPGPLREALGLTVLRVESLPPSLKMPVAWRDGDGGGDGDGDGGGDDGDGDGDSSGENHAPGAASHWREVIDAHDAQILAAFEDGGGAVLQRGDFFYLAGRADARLLDAVVARALRHAGLNAARPPAEMRVRRRGELLWFFNYGAQPAAPHLDGEVILGETPVPPGGVLALRPSGTGRPGT